MQQERSSFPQHVRRVASGVREGVADWRAGGGIKTTARRALKSVPTGILLSGSFGFICGELLPALAWAYSPQMTDAPEYGIPAGLILALVGGVVGLLDAVTYPLRKERQERELSESIGSRFNDFTRRIDPFL